jgi:hypothetical protein
MQLKSHKVHGKQLSTGQEPDTVQLEPSRVLASAGRRKPLTGRKLAKATPNRTGHPTVLSTPSKIMAFTM